MTTLADYRANRHLYQRRPEILIDYETRGWLANVPDRVWVELMVPDRARKIPTVIPIIDGNRIGLHWPSFGLLGYIQGDRARRLIGLDSGPTRGLEASVAIWPMELMVERHRATSKPGRVRYLIERATLLDEDDPRLERRRVYRAKSAAGAEAARSRAAQRASDRAARAEAHRAASGQYRQGELL